ncbi:MAG: FIST C-terminal domain-containing protein [Phycisphaerales bacterium]|nr:FIST C-terminal domain-containing protein [Phycisphaerales bacterium]
MPTTKAQPAAAAALNAHFDTRTAAYELAAHLREGLAKAGGDGGSARCDAVALFGSYHHRAAFEDAAEILRHELEPGVLVGTTADSVVGGDTELEGRAGLSALALRVPGASLRPFRLGMHELLTSTDAPELFRQYLGVDEQRRTAIVFADPFTTPAARLLPLLRGTADLPAVSAIGGFASGASQPGQNVLLLDRAAYIDGMVGIAIGGVRVDALISQGCRPVGPPLVVTKAAGNMILELGGRRAVEAAQGVVFAMNESDRALLSRGLQVGVVVNEYQARFGRGDFVVRGILGVNARNGGLAVNDMPRVGQTIQFHLRDPATAEEDLQLLLDAAQLEDRPFASLLFSCAGRGTRLFSEPNRDVGAIQRRLGPLPLAGFSATGEIGPLGDRCLVHGHTVCAALLRGA